ncbi:hypothetical protein [Spirosoma daeguense]
MSQATQKLPNRGAHLVNRNRLTSQTARLRDALTVAREPTNEHYFMASHPTTMRADG